MSKDSEHESDLPGLSSFAAVERMPSWARVMLGAALIGSASTLGYQLGR